MAERDNEPLERVHVVLFSEDIQKIRALYGANPGFSRAIRSMVRSFLKRLDEKALETKP